MNEMILVWGAMAILGCGVLACFTWQWAHRNDCETKRIANEGRLTRLETEMDGVMRKGER